jgi:hypothetical protein
MHVKLKKKEKNLKLRKNKSSNTHFESQIEKINSSNTHFKLRKKKKKLQIEDTKRKTPNSGKTKTFTMRHMDPQLERRGFFDQKRQIEKTKLPGFEGVR